MKFGIASMRKIFTTEARRFFFRKSSNHFIEYHTSIRDFPANEYNPPCLRASVVKLLRT